MQQLVGYLLERQKALLALGITDKTGIETVFDFGNDPLVYIAHFSYGVRGSDVEIEQRSSINDRYSDLFGISAVDEYSFHCFVLNPIGSDSRIEEVGDFMRTIMSRDGKPLTKIILDRRRARTGYGSRLGIRRASSITAMQPIQDIA